MAGPSFSGAGGFRPPRFPEGSSLAAHLVRRKTGSQIVKRFACCTALITGQPPLLLAPPWARAAGSQLRTSGHALRSGGGKAGGRAGGRPRMAVGTASGIKGGAAGGRGPDNPLARGPAVFQPRSSRFKGPGGLRAQRTTPGIRRGRLIADAGWRRLGSASSDGARASGHRQG